MHRFLILLATFVCCTLAGAADLASLDSRQLLKRLDETIKHRLEYRETYIAHIDSMKRSAAAQTPELRAETYRRIFEAYCKLQSDSAMTYLSLMEQLPLASTDADYANVIRTGRAEVYGIMGLYSSAVRALQTVDVSHSSPDVVLYFYQVARTLYGWMADFDDVSGQREYFSQLTQQYRDSILAVQQPSINRSIVEADNECVAGHSDRALEICTSSLASADALQRCYIYFTLADVARAEGHIDDQVRYLAICAISDLERGITEYSALPRLAVLLSENGDSERAYDYLLCTMADANYCKARLRAVEASSVFPIIEREHEQKLVDRQRMSFIVIGFALLGIVLLIVGFLFLSRRARALQQARADLDDAVKSLQEVNDALQRTNDELTMSNKVKETYVARYLERCRSYIDTMNSLRKNHLKLLRNRQFDELMAQLKSDGTITSEEESFFADFDEAFLTICPNFISHFNALLPEDAQIVPKRDELLTTELRIFALIRLGITDSNRIAHFLGYSLPTRLLLRSRER